MKDFSAFTIPLKEAQEWTKQWQSSYSKLPKAFTLPVEDLLGCLTEMGLLIRIVMEMLQLSITKAIR